MCMLFGIHTQGVASLALGYALVGLSARFYALMPLRGRISTHLTGRFCALMPFQGVSVRFFPFGDAYPRILWILFNSCQRFFGALLPFAFCHSPLWLWAQMSQLTETNTNKN